jgi:PAS domain S-box-containing protein
VNRFPPLVWISLGLVSLTLSVILVADLLVDLVPDERLEKFKYRRTLCEALAVQYSKLAERSHIQMIEQAAQALVERNQDILSVALRTADGTALVKTANHDHYWVQPPEDQSTPNHIQVPIYAGDSHWGTLQIAFLESQGSFVSWLLADPWIRFLGFVTAVGFLVYLLFMKRTLRHLDPSTVIPMRVKAALDALAEGVVLLDPQEIIVLANSAFAERVGRESNELIGHNISELQWTFPDSNSWVVMFPWSVTIKSKMPRVGVQLCLPHPSGETKRFIINSAPILDDHGVLSGVLASFDDVTELERANESLRNEITERQRVEAEREKLHERLLESSRLAGMAEVASNVLHNVGNVLNSVNVSSNMITAKLRTSPIGDLERIVAMLNDHARDLGSYLERDEKGKRIPEYLGKLAGYLRQERSTTMSELEALSGKVDHIKQIISAQQTIAKSAGLREPVRLPELMDQALMIALPSLDRHEITVMRNYLDTPEVVTDRHQVLQILVNLVTNARQAMAVNGRSHQLTLYLGPSDDHQGFVRLQVSDTGIGIKPEHLSRLFSQGFTTKPNGHGLGLHNGALTAKLLGGRLSAYSNGENQGAIFTLELPIEYQEGKK